jgi:WD40 repeat protein
MSRVAGRLARLTVSCYPRRWRRRYGEELLALLEDRPSSLRTVSNLVLGALGTHLDPGYRREGMAMAAADSSLRMAAQVAAVAGALVAVTGGLLALQVIGDDQLTLSVSHSAGIAVSPDTRLGVTAQSAGPGSPGFDLVWRIGPHPRLLAHFPGAAPLAFAPAGPLLLAASPRGVTEWSLAHPSRPARVAALPGPGTAVGIAYSPGQPLAAIAYGSRVQLWNLARPAAPRRIATIPAGVRGPTMSTCGNCNGPDQIGFSPDGRTLAMSAAHHAVSLWDVSVPSAPRHLATTGRDNGPVEALAFSPDGSQLACLTINGKLTVFRLADPAHPVYAAVPGPPSWLAAQGTSALSYSPDGARLTAVVLIAATGAPRIVCTWTTAGGLQSPLAAGCRRDHFPVQGAFTFTASRTGIIGPDPRGYNPSGPEQRPNPLVLWPPLPG